VASNSSDKYAAWAGSDFAQIGQNARALRVAPVMQDVLDCALPSEFGTKRRVNIVAVAEPLWRLGLAERQLMSNSSYS
jgi:hypothetical protein